MQGVSIIADHYKQFLMKKVQNKCNQGIHFLKKHFIATLVILLWIKTVAISFISFQLPIHSWVDIVLIVISPLGIIMIILGFGFLFKKQVPPVTMLIIYLLMIGLVYANLLYYRFYIDFVTVSVFLQLHNVGGARAKYC